MRSPPIHKEQEVRVWGVGRGEEGGREWRPREKQEGCV